MDIRDHIKASFARQELMATLGAELLSVAVGQVEIGLPMTPKLGQQKGFAHGAVAFAIGDSAAGYAAVSTMTPEDDVVTSEMGIHFLAPGKGDRLVARGSVIKPGKRLLVAQADVFALSDGQETLIARLTGTMIRVPSEA